MAARSPAVKEAATRAKRAKVPRADGELIAEELAELLGVAGVHVSRWVAAGLIAARRVKVDGARPGRPFVLVAAGEVERVRALHAIARRCGVPMHALLKLSAEGVSSLPASAREPAA